MSARADTDVSAVYSYETRAGDTLIGIGQDLLANPLQWPRLQKLNKIKDPYRLQPGSRLQIPLSLLKRDPAAARIRSVQGAALRNGTALATGDTLRERDQVTTGEQSFVTIELIDGSQLVVQPESRMRVDTLTHYRNTHDAQTILNLEQGRIESIITRNAAPSPKYIIRTPTAAIGVRGTRFRVGAAGNDATRTEVTDGVVGLDHEHSNLAVEAGFGVVAQAGMGLTSPIALLEPPDLSAVPALHERPVVRFAIPPVPGAKHYRFQVGRDAEMRSLVGERVSELDSTKFTDLADGEYTLRVRGIDERGLEGKDADIRFTLKARPEPPFIRSPLDGSRLRAEAIGFAWAGNPEAEQYRIQIARSPDFSDLVADVAAIEATQLAEMKLPPGDYYWRARSLRAGNDIGPWGDASHFTLRPLPPAPEPPVINEHHISFGWAGEPGQRFLFQLARDAAFLHLVAERQLDTPQTTLERPEAGRYYMRVQATDPDGVIGPFTTPQYVDVPNPPPPRWLPLLLLLVPLV